MTEELPLTRSQVLALLRMDACASGWIDFAILRFVFPRVSATHLRIADDDPGAFLWQGRDAQNHANLWNRGRIPSYTSSLDAALTIVPSGWRTLCANERSIGPERWTWLLTNGRRLIEARAPTAPLAVCIAAVTALPDLW